MQSQMFRTVGYRIKDEQLTLAARSVCLASKNLRNCGVFIVRNILSAHADTCFKTDAELTANERKVLALANQAADECNATRAKKSKEDSRMLSHFGSGAPWAQILNVRVLDKVLRLFKDDSGAFPYEALPCVAAKQVTAQIIQEFSSWREGLKAWRGPVSGANRPQMPGYLGRSELNPISMHVDGMGVDHLPTIKTRSLFLDYGKRLALSEAARAAWKSYDFSELKRELTRMVKRTGAQLAMLRILPKRDGFWFEGVFKCPVEINDASFLGKLCLLASAGKVEPNGAAWQSMVKRRLSELKAEELPAAAGLDLGINNLATLSFSTGHHSMVISAGSIERRLAHVGRLSDQRRSMLATPAMRAAQSCQDKGRALDSREASELRFLRRAAARDPVVQELCGIRERFLQNTLHQTAASLVAELKRRGVELLVVGRNKGWKQAWDTSRQQNRRFHDIPHERFLGMIKDKTFEAGIATLEVEESYTSKTSFALGEKLDLLDAVKKERSREAKRNHACGMAATTHEDLPPRRGSRKAPVGRGGGGRHQFVTPGEGRWEHLHADANGAYNILRKALPSFARHPGLSSKFEMFWISTQGVKAWSPSKLNALKFNQFEPGWVPAPKRTQTFASVFIS